MGAAIGMYLFLSYLPLSWILSLWVPWNNKLGKIVGNVIAIDTFSNHMKLWKNEKIWLSHTRILMLISHIVNLHRYTLGYSSVYLAWSNWAFLFCNSFKFEEFDVIDHFCSSMELKKYYTSVILKIDIMLLECLSEIGMG